MNVRVLGSWAIAGIAMFGVACSTSPESPLSPTSSADGTTTAAADGSTLKVSAPVLLSPGGGETVSSQRPSFSFRNSTGSYVGISGLSYRLQLLNQDGSVAAEREIQQTGGDTTIVGADGDLEFERTFTWRVRAELAGAFSSWSAAEAFRTPNRPVSTSTAPSQGGVGPARSISLQEAFAIIRRVHDDLRWNLGSASSREQRVEFLFSAVAAIHYGHPRFNPAGPDSNWCVKDAGQGRPASDDVLVQCRSRDSWDLIGGAGANGYSFHLDYIGVLPSIQNVYPPPASYLNSLR